MYSRNVLLHHSPLPTVETIIVVLKENKIVTVMYGLDIVMNMRNKATKGYLFSVDWFARDYMWK